MKQGGEESKALVKKIKRIVVRGDRAVALFEGSKTWNTLVKKDGEWRSD